MKAEFLTIDDKVSIKERIESGDKSVFKDVINEIERLESIIRDYEIAFDVVMGKVESKTNKSPKWYGI